MGPSNVDRTQQPSSRAFFGTESLGNLMHSRMHATPQKRQNQHKQQTKKARFHGKENFTAAQIGAQNVMPSAVGWSGRVVGPNSVTMPSGNLVSCALTSPTTSLAFADYAQKLGESVNVYSPVYPNTILMTDMTVTELRPQPSFDEFSDESNMMVDKLTNESNDSTAPHEPSATLTAYAALPSGVPSPFLSHHVWYAAPSELSGVRDDVMPPSSASISAQPALSEKPKKRRSRGTRSSGLVGRCKRSVIDTIRAALVKAITKALSKHSECVEAANQILSMSGEEDFSVLGLAAQFAAAEVQVGPFSVLSSLLHGELMNKKSTEDEQEAECMDVLMYVVHPHEVDANEVQRVASVALCEKWLPADIREACANGISLLCVEGHLPPSFITKNISYAAEASLQHPNDIAGHLSSACTVLERIAQVAHQPSCHDVNKRKDSLMSNRVVPIGRLESRCDKVVVYSMAKCDFASTLAAQISSEFCCGEMIKILGHAANVHNNNVELAQRVDCIAKFYGAL